MSIWLILCCSLWVIAGTVTAFLPMRRQMVPGMALILTAPVLLVWIGMTLGWAWVVAGLLAFGSMFRNPLIYFYKKWRGIPVDLPSELQK